MSMSSLEPEYMVGDLVYARNYIYYPWRGQHVSIVVNEAEVVQAIPPLTLGGVVSTPLASLEEHWAYSLFGGVGSVYRVKGLSDMDRQEIAEYAVSQIGKPFLFWSPKYSTGTWYCEKIVWRAILEGSGIDVDSDSQLGGWVVTGDDMKDSPHTEQVS